MKRYCNRFCVDFRKVNESHKEYEEFSMKRMKTSERKHTRMSLIFCLFFLLPFLMGACISEEKEYTAKVALEEYRKDWLNLKKTRSVTSSVLISKIKEWQESSNRKYQILLEDSLIGEKDSLYEEFLAISDSVKNEFIRLGGRMKCSFYDYANIKFNTSNFEADSTMIAEIEEGRRIFAKLDSTEVLKAASAENLIPVYVKFLKDAKAQGFTSEEQIFDFICAEEVLFKTFLSLLNDIWNKDFNQINVLTEDVCGMIYKSALNKNVNDETVLAWMAMRTNRRLIGNARIAEQQLLKQKTKDEAQAVTYFYMVLQPFLSFDHFSVYTLSDKQKEELYRMAKDVPKLIDKMDKYKIMDRQVFNRMPGEMLGLYLTTL